ncbi:hypothetical protein JXM67_03850 [candidate division WOR-3 bacterium]|nr:hypothetical protein [candidate division WOR-3 bacterium]
MKRLLVFGIIILGLFVVGCENENYARIELSNPDDLPQAYAGSFKSDLIDSTYVLGTTPSTHEVEVDPEGDHVWAVFWKTTYTDTENELKVELYYGSQLKAAQTVKIPIVGLAIVQCDIP